IGAPASIPRARAASMAWCMPGRSCSIDAAPSGAFWSREVEQRMADTAQFPPGEMLDEKYRIDQLLSVGGMGAVYIGTHTLLRKRVAIKVLRTELAGSSSMIERFQREAVAASA